MDVIGQKRDESVECRIASDGVGDDEAPSHCIDACFGVVGVELGEEELEWFDGEEGVIVEICEGAGECDGGGRGGVGSEGCVEIGCECGV